MSTTNKERQRVKYYTDNATTIPTLSPADTLSAMDGDEIWYANGTTNCKNKHSTVATKAIDRSDFTTKRDPINATALLDRQFAPRHYVTDYDTESDLRKPETCYIGQNSKYDANSGSACVKGALGSDKFCQLGKRSYKINLDGVLEANEKSINNRLQNINTDTQIGGPGSATDPKKLTSCKSNNLQGSKTRISMSKSNEQMATGEAIGDNDVTGILIKDVDSETREKYMMNCSQRRKNLDWSHYRAPPKQINGQGFGNPNNYHQTRYGLDSRHDCKGPLRDVDYKDREMIPLDSFLWNYKDVRYDTDIRLGVPTRTFKKANTNYNE